MKKYQFKTNINCSGCIEKATPVLNAVVGENNWTVDTQNPQKVLTVTTDALSEREVAEAVDKAGYRAESLQ